MATVMKSAKLTRTTKLGPLDHGRPMSFAQFMAADQRLVE